MDLTRTIDSLGLTAELRSEVEFVHLVERGFPVSTVAELQRLGTLSNTELAQIIPRRALAHARRSGCLPAEMSDRVARVVAVFALAHDTFASETKANDWMRRPNSALEGATPFSLLRTGSGAKLVEQVLGRIAYGVFT